jgi:hypothetical protein
VILKSKSKRRFASFRVVLRRFGSCYIRKNSIRHCPTLNPEQFTFFQPFPGDLYNFPKKSVFETS